MPTEVYLLMEPNAFVAQRGGIMGLGSRRVMGIGLPLLKTLTVSELRAVLVHEFGHYYGGDTRLGPLIYRTRGMVIRTVSGLSGNSLFTYLIRLPFYGYARLYLRITQSVSRAQEFSADKLSAKIAGSRQAIQALSTIHGVNQAWNVYWRDEFVPALVLGYIPPLSDGFGQFLKAAPVARQLSTIIERESKESQTNPYDSHPSLKDRITALQSLSAEPANTDDSPAIALIKDLTELEMAILKPLADKNHLPDLKSVSWENLVALVYIPNWQKMVNEQKPFLAGLTVESLPDLAVGLDHRENKLANAGNLNVAQTSKLTNSVVGAALTLALMKHGWRIVTSPGEPVYAVKEGQKINSFDILVQLKSNSLAANEWLNICQKLGISKLDLAFAAET
jgi:Zn-dependent protease with chaperone function